MRRGHRLLASAAVIAFSVLASPMAAASDTVGDTADETVTGEHATEQWRSYWVDSFDEAIHTPENVDELIADARDINANVLIVQVSRWMDCFCDRSSFPRTHVAIDPGFDPLDDVVAKAHAAGLEVHAWVNATPAWNLENPPEDPEHVVNRHGHDAEGWDNWLNVRADGERTAGPHLLNLDPANPAAVDYVVEGVASIVREYDVDGINLDYIRYPDENSAGYQSDWGYTAASLDRFHAATGRSDVPEPGDPQFSDWRRDQVTHLTRKIFLTMYALDPGVVLSVNGITYWYGPQTEGGWEATRTYAEVLQDWRGWLEEGIVDVNVAMNYKEETDEGDRRQMYDEWNEVLKDWQGDRFSVIGPALYLNTVEDNVEQARRALEPSEAGNTAAGWSGYSYAAPSGAASADPDEADAERSRLARALTTGEDDDPLFGAPAAVPEMPWRTDPAAGHLTGELVTTRGTALDQVEVTATHLETGETVSGRVSDGSGWFGFADLAPGTWLVSAELPLGVIGRPADVVEVTAGEVVSAELTPLLELIFTR